jgi:hypothetical protein
VDRALSANIATGATHQPFGGVTALTYGNGLALAKGYAQDYLIGTLSIADGSTAILDRGLCVRRRRQPPRHHRQPVAGAQRGP